MANSRKKISELPALSVASLDTTFVLGISGSTTYKISINNLTSSLDGAFATDLVTNALSSSLNSKLSTSSFNSYTASAINGTISGSSQLTSSFDIRYTLSGSVAAGTISSSAQITSFGFISASTTPAGTISSSAQITSLGFVSGSYATTGSNTFNGNQIISGSLKTNETQISLGFRAGSSTQGYGGIAIGANAATSSQGQNAIAIGIEAGEQSQGIYSVALGNGAGKIQQGQSSVSIGGSAGIQNQSPNAVAVGDRAGAYQQGSGSIAIGYKAGEFYQPNNTIIIDANGGDAAFGLTQTGSFYVSPIRNASGTDGALQYNATTKEITYSDKFENKGTGILSGSAQITAFGFISSSAAIPAGTISGSSQLTSSFDTRYLNTGGDGVISGSAQLPSGLISGSTQLTTAFPSKTTGAWSAPAGASTQSFTVEAGASYTMWVNGNIPNGIITWNATVTTSNTNVPVVGSQYGWYYTAGNALVLTAMPDQIIGTTNTLISSPSSYAPNTSNVFKFGITNNSGTTQTINYGYIKLS
jgi:hypothetical protein